MLFFELSEKIDIIAQKFLNWEEMARLMIHTMAIKYFHLLISVFTESAYTFFLIIILFTKNGGFYEVTEG